MKFFLAVFLILFFLPTLAYAGQFEDGMGALYRGNSQVALKLLRPLAEQGIAEAQVVIGQMYSGDGSTQGADKAGKLGTRAQDYIEAATWFRKAADQGDAEALYWLGHLYQDGHGVIQDDAEAAKLFDKVREAGEHGNAVAERLVGRMYDFGEVRVTGQHLKRNYAEAAKWYREAAEQGDAEAEERLGGLYEAGSLEVGKNTKEAMKWIRRAADQGYLMAQMDIGAAYSVGSYVTQDYVEAAKWYRKAAEQGFGLAQSFLGELYESGKGVQQDYAEAYFWYSLASPENFPFSAAALSKIGAHLTSEQRAMVEKHLEEWKPVAESPARAATPKP